MDGKPEIDTLGSASDSNAGMSGDAGSGRTRRPMQSRSVASLDRMVAAARKLMIERQSEDFTLQEVSLRGKVSIGSIYHRFDSKEELVRAVLGQAMDTAARAEKKAFDKTLRESTTLAQYIPGYIHAFGTILRDNSLMLRLTMRRAAADAGMSRAGDQREQESAEDLAAGLSHFRDEIAGDPVTKSHMAFHITFATLARHLSLDSNDPLSVRLDWDVLLTELSQMIVAYLKAPAAA